MSDEWRLGPELLRSETDPGVFAFESTEELSAPEEVIGQQRAVRAIDFGVSMPNKGYNIYVVGPTGSGRTEAVKQFLERRAVERPAPPEWCYVYNFEEAREPRALELPAGTANTLRSMMEEFIDQLKAELPSAFEGQPYEERRRAFMQEMQEEQQQLYEDLEEYLNERGFALIRSQMGLAIAPMKDGEVLSAEEYQKLDPETKRQYEAYRPELQEEFEKAMRQARELDRKSKQAIEEIQAEMAGFVVDNLMEDLREEFADQSQVIEYLDAVREDVISNVDRFLPDENGPQLPFGLRGGQQKERWFNRYAINVLVDSQPEQRAPVIVEDNPTYHNLIGRIEHRTEFGTMVTDFTQIRAGALHKANGGYLVVEARNLLTNPLSYDSLKRALRNAEIKIEEMARFFGLVAAASLEPEPVPLDVKVVVIGDMRLYYLLYAYDEDFREHFKVKAEFAVDMERNDSALHELACFVGDLCRREDLRHFDPTAMARLAEESARTAIDQEKLTTRLADMADLVRESAYWAGQAGHDLVTREDVERAVGEEQYRLNYAKERYLETIQNGTILIDTEGETVGQINALSVAQAAEYLFGLPTRISARTFLGRSSVVSIEREVKLSGPIHDKGNLILSSYLASRFAQHRPLSMAASLTFEQNYGGVEGDSASSTELYALLSSLADVPIKQSLAVTGSVSQSGEVQAIGGVNAKIEGFFDLCRERGLNGDQGIVIPRSNVRNLMLRSDVVEAVREDKFHIYAVSTIEEGVELLTGMPAGVEDGDGEYPEGTLYALVKKKLDAYADRMKKAGQTGRLDSQGNDKNISEDEAENEDDEGLPDPGIPLDE